MKVGTFVGEEKMEREKKREPSKEKKKREGERLFLKLLARS